LLICPDLSEQYFMQPSADTRTDRARVRPDGFGISFPRMEAPLMLRLRSLFLVALASLAVGSRADAAIILVANLTGSQEVPPNGSTATGFGMFILNDAMTEMSYDITITGLDFGLVTIPTVPGNPNPQTPNNPNDDLLAAHIHRAPAGTNGPVIFGFIGNPFTDVDDAVVTRSATGVGGRVTGVWDLNEGNGLFSGQPVTLANQLEFILSGQTYVNFHTREFQGGEIRGQLQLIPEPSTVVLLGVGVTLFGARGLRRMRSR
jgi:hypothetical protein